ncbi:MAG: S8 family serine peptidase [Blastocatellia bacterium]
MVEAQAQQKPEVTLLVASVTGANERVVRAATSLGGRVQYRADDVSYLRVKLPTGSAEKIALSPDIEAINVDGPIVYLSGPPGQGEAQARPNTAAPPSRDTPAENPYLPAVYLGAPQFVASHPTFDGRGVTVAMIDTSIDLLLPELQTATTLDGQPTRKIADVLCAEPSAIDPDDHPGDLSSYVKVSMPEQVTGSGGKFTYQEESYTAPAAGRYRIGSLDERVSGPAGDLNRDGNPPGSRRLFAALWEESANTVWVDTNQNRSFADEKAMTDYPARHDVGVFGSDNPATPVRETVGFTVRTDARRKLVFIFPGYGEHGSGVSGGAFGKSFFGGRINGVAPEAQIVSVPFSGPLGGVTHALIESLIVAVKHPQVDLVTMQAGLVMTFNDGGSALSTICNRLVRKYQKPIFVSGGNYQGGVGYVIESAAASEVMTVGSYIHRETSRVNRGVASARDDNVDGYSPSGPRRDGGFKPDILALTQSLSTYPGFLPGYSRLAAYALPPGYSVYGGTSTAAPMAAAAAALLISAAKQSGVKYDAQRLRWAIKSSARYLPGIGAYEQGPGLFQIGAAWEALRRAPSSVEITSRAPINADLSQYLRTPGEGPGIYEREGWAAGQTGQRTITFTRATGPADAITYRLRWTGNDGTFSSAETISLPLNQPVPLSIKISPRAPGIHSAILNLDEPGGARAVYQALNTVVAAEQLTAANGFAVTREAEAEWMTSYVYSFNVPANAAALKVEARITRGNVMPFLAQPSGAGFHILARRPAPSTAYQTGGSWSRVIPAPAPGVWQLMVANNNSDSQADVAVRSRAAFTLTAAVLGARPSPAMVTINSTELSENITREFRFTNHLGAFTGGVASAPLGSAFTAKPILFAQGKPRVYEVNVPPGAASVGARIGAAADSAADLDLYLFDCSGQGCVLKDFSQRDRANERVEVENPAAGKWKVVIDPCSAPAGQTSCDYRDLFTHPAFGAITPTESPSLRSSGATWAERVSVRVGAVPTSPRSLAGQVTVAAKAEPNVNDEVKTTGSQTASYPTQVALGAARIELKLSRAFDRQLGETRKIR